MMLHLKKLKKYTPKINEKNSAVFDFVTSNNIAIVFYKDENEQDWYESFSLFNKDTMKIAYDQSGTVQDYNLDVSAIVPDNLSVIEVDSKNIPDGLDRLGNWIVDDEVIKPKPIDYIANAEIQKLEWLDKANKKIEIIQDAQLLGIATDEENININKWKMFRILLTRINTDDAPNISWPEWPVS